MNLPTTTLPIGEIVIDDSLQPRCDGLNEDHVLALMETPEDWPPITIAHDRGEPVVIDGFHRYEAARRLGHESIAAKVFYPDQNADLFRIAFSLNIQHGRPLTRRDRNAYAAHLLRRHPELSDREIAEALWAPPRDGGGDTKRTRRVSRRRTQTGRLARRSGAARSDPARKGNERTKDDRGLRRATGDRARRSLRGRLFTRTVARRSD